MGDHHEGNETPNPGNAEKKRFGFASNHSTDFELREKTGSVQTRFGVVPPALTQSVAKTRTLNTGPSRFEGSQAPNSDTEDAEFLASRVEPVYSHGSDPKPDSLFWFVFFRTLRGIVFFLLLLILLGLGFYFVFYDSIHSRQTIKPDSSESASNRSATVRFFDLSASGRQFVFLIDTTGFMRTQADSSGLLLIKSNLQRSLRDLKEFHSFELLCFDSRISATFGQNAKAALVSADTSNLSVARERIENILPKPEEDEDISNDGDLKGAILAALALKPDTLFLICHSANAEQLNGVAQGEIRKAAAQTKLYAVEVANSIKPLYETPLEKLANNLGGDYQWLNILQKVSPRSRELNWSPDENVSIPSLTDMIDADFKFYGDVSRKETQGYSPFGKEVVAVRDRSPEGDGSLDSPKQLSLGDAVIREIETDARIVYLSGFTGLPQNPQMLRVGAENRLALWIQGAKAELPAAEYLIGLCYKNGVRVTPDEDKALQCQLKAALQGCLPAMFLVAMEYQARSEINSTDQNASTSVAYWVEKGAKLGEPFAQCYWANHFTHTLEERYIWLEKAARQELPEAQYLLGKCLETGSGTLADKSAAAVWYEKAAKQGLVAAQNALDKLKSDL